jgi:hypothetical protein
MSSWESSAQARESERVTLTSTLCWYRREMMSSPPLANPHYEKGLGQAHIAELELLPHDLPGDFFNGQSRELFWHLIRCFSNVMFHPFTLEGINQI